MLASKSKLRNYTVEKVFVREDLSLEARKDRAKQWQKRKVGLFRSDSKSSLSSHSSSVSNHTNPSSEHTVVDQVINQDDS